jgi:hypothetical protein
LLLARKRAATCHKNDAEKELPHLKGSSYRDLSGGKPTFLTGEVIDMFGRSALKACQRKWETQSH